MPGHQTRLEVDPAAIFENSKQPEECPLTADGNNGRDVGRRVSWVLREYILYWHHIQVR